MEILEKTEVLSETKRLDNIIFANRRKMMTLAGTAFAGLALSQLGTKQSEAQSSAPTDADILNFALNLEYLEAQYYTLATSGQTIDQKGVSITGGGGTAGSVTVKSNPMVPFTIPTIQSYANETAQEERNHVTFLSNALGSAAVAMPNIDLLNSFNALAVAAKIGSSFDPFASDINFLLGSYIFEDVGVTAYNGAAGLISTPAYLVAAAGILAVEAYHAGLVRTSLFGLDAQNPTAGINATATAISNARASLDGTGNDDIGLGTVTNSLGLTAATIVNADSNTLAFSRTTTQVLAIVYGGGSGGGAFFPQGLNGNIK
jgi:hypothetical protein